MYSLQPVYVIGPNRFYFIVSGKIFVFPRINVAQVPRSSEINAASEKRRTYM